MLLRYITSPSGFRENIYACLVDLTWQAHSCPSSSSSSSSSTNTSDCTGSSPTYIMTPAWHPPYSPFICFTPFTEFDKFVEGLHSFKTSQRCCTIIYHKPFYNWLWKYKCWGGLTMKSLTIRFPHLSFAPPWWGTAEVLSAVASVCASRPEELMMLFLDIQSHDVPNITQDV